MAVPIPAPVRAPATTSAGQWWAIPTRATPIAAANGTRTTLSPGQIVPAAAAKAKAFAAWVDGKDDAAGRLADPRVTSAVNVDGRSRWTACWMAHVTALVTTTAAIPAAPALRVDRRAASAPPSNGQTKPRSATLLIHGRALPQLPRLATSERRSHRLSARLVDTCYPLEGEAVHAKHYAIPARPRRARGPPAIPVHSRGREQDDRDASANPDCGMSGRMGWTGPMQQSASFAAE